MSVNEGSAASGRFVASASPMPVGGKRYPIYAWAVFALPILGFLLYATHGRSLNGGVMALLFVPFALLSLVPFLRWFRHKKVLICVTGDGLTVDTRPGDVFSFSDTKLGLWSFGMYGGTTMGTALHMESGHHHFVIGGRDHRIAAGTRLDEPPVEYVDATMSAPDFDELLTAVGRRSVLDVYRPAPGRPTRCLLIPCPAWFFADTFTGSLANLVKPFRRPRLNPEASLALDVDNDAVWVIDPSTNTQIASAPLAHVTATPAKCTYYRKSGMTMPVLIVRIPGLQERIGAKRPLTIACRETRFSWPGDVPEEKAPAFTVSGADWLTLVEKFGLAPYLARRDLLE